MSIMACRNSHPCGCGPSGGYFIAPQWIKCSERMPEIPEGAIGSAQVLAYFRDGGGWPRMAVRYTYGWERPGGRTTYALGEVTHWMPLPHPPTDARGVEES